MSMPSFIFVIIIIALLIVAVITHYIAKYSKVWIEASEEELNRMVDNKRQATITKNYIKRIDRGEFVGLHCDDCGREIDDGKEKEVEDEDDPTKMLTLCKGCYTIRKFATHEIF